MRTCPACGEDTEAADAEPCTACGYAIASGNGTDAEATAKKRPQWARLVIWLIALAAVFAIAKLGPFEQQPGPDPGAVEDAITENAADNGVTLTVDCPESAAEAEVDSTFRCAATTADGQTFRIPVTNEGDTFSWPSGRIAALG